MKLPTNLIIGPMEFDVLKTTEPITGNNGESLDGQTSYDNGTILIDSSINDYRVRVTVMRAIVNACSRSSGFTMPTKQEEDFTNWLINALLANPQLLEMFA